MENLEKNKIGTFFGPSGIAAGWLFIVAGILLIPKSEFSILLVVPGALLAFSYSSVIIDKASRKIRPTNTLFGILKFGKWLEIKGDMHLSIKANNLIYRTYSRSNRRNDIKTHNYSIFLTNSENNKIIPLKNCKLLSEAQSEAEKYARILAVALKK